MRRRTSLSGDFSSRKRLTILRSSCCSSVKPKFIPALFLPASTTRAIARLPNFDHGPAWQSLGMDNVEQVWSDAAVEVHRMVVGPIENNVYVVRCRRTGVATLVDAANEPDRLLAAAGTLGVTSVLTTHGHWDHIQAVAPMRDAGIDVYVREEDAAELSGYDHLLQDDEVLSVGDLRVRATHTPGHTAGSICFLVEGTPLLFSGDTLFPGGPGATGS